LSKKPHLQALVWILWIGLTFRLLAAFPESSGHFEDMLEWASYGGVSQDLASGIPAPALGDARGILLTWQIVINPIMRLFGPSPAALDVLGILASLIGLALVYLLGEKLAGGNAGLVAAGFWAVCRPAAHLATVNYSLAEPVLFILGLYLTVAALDRKDGAWGLVLAGGFALGMAHGIRPFVPVLPAACGTLLLTDRGKSISVRLGRSALLAFGFAVAF